MENAEVVGTDEAFFDDDQNDQAVVDLYNEKAGILDGEEDNEVDLASYAYQIWKNAIAHAPSLQQIIPDLPPVAFDDKTLVKLTGEVDKGLLQREVDVDRLEITQ